MLLLTTAVAPRLAPAAPARPVPPLDAAPFGLNTHLATRYPDLGSMSRAADVVARSGAGWAREDIHWYRIQPDPATWDWSFTDQAMRELLARNIKIVGVLGHPPGWATPYSGDAPADVSFYAPDPQRFAAFAAHAEESTDKGVVVLPDVRGLYRFYEELALRFAERRVNAVAVDYFGRTAGIGKRDDDFPYMDHVAQTTEDDVQADIAAAVAYLASDDAAFVTGTSIVVDGGLTIGTRASWDATQSSLFSALEAFQ